MNRRIAFGLAFAALLSACTVGPDFKTPDARIPASWHDSQAASAPEMTSGARGTPPAQGTSRITTDSDPDPRWWRAFGDATLDQLVERAVGSNLDLQQAVLRIGEARAQVQGAAAQGLPDVRATASYQREQLGIKGFLESQGVYDKVDQLGAPGSPVNQFAPGSGAAVQNGASNLLNQLTSPINLWQAGFDASWELDLFGRVRRSVEAAGAQEQAAIESHNDALVSLVAEVAQTYTQLRGAQAQRDIAVGLIDQQREVLTLTQSQAHAGLASDADVRNASAQLAQTQAQLPQFEQQIAQASNALSYLLGEAPGSLDSLLAAAAPVPPVPPTVPVGLPSTLARRRPDIRRAEANLHAATANVGVAVAQFYPDISLTGQVGTRATHAGDLTRWSHLFYSFGPSVSLPVFQGGALVSNLRLSQAQQQEAALEYRKAVLTALSDVDNALTACRTDQSRRDALARSVADQQVAFDLARDSYRQGLVSFINVLDTERQLSQARQQYAQGTTQVTTDVVALYKALGGGWETLPHATDTAPRASVPATSFQNGQAR